MRRLYQRLTRTRGVLGGYAELGGVRVGKSVETTVHVSNARLTGARTCTVPQALYFVMQDAICVTLVR